MAELLPSRFTRYALTPEEEEQSVCFTETQKMMFHNLRADAAETRLALVYDPLSPLEFVQEEARLKGQIQVIDWLLSQSDKFSR
jgi:hypothetical protein